MNSQSAIVKIWSVFRAHWTLFLALHVMAGLVVGLALAPLFSILLGWIVRTTGNVALTDQAIVLAFLSPVGVVLGMVAIGIWITVTLFEGAATLLATNELTRGRRPHLIKLLKSLLVRLRALFQLTLAIGVRVIFLALPFLAIAGWLFLTFLTEFDINYYLTKQPPILWRVGAAIGIVVLLMALLLLRMAIGWFIALPLVLLGNVHPHKALQESRSRLDGERMKIVRFLIGWGLVVMLAFFCSGLLLQLGLGWLVTISMDSLRFLAWSAGALIVLWSVSNLMIGLFATVGFVLAVLSVYRERSGNGELEQTEQRLDQQADTRRFSSWRVSLALVLVLVVAQVAVLQRQLSNGGSHPEPAIMAHRGASWDAPENTLAAIEAAIEQGADWAEIDVQETRDGRVLVIHDRDLMKVAGSPLRVYDAPFDTLREVDIGSHKGPQYADQRVPLLSEVLRAAKGRIKLNIELKYYGREEQLEARVAELVERYDMVDDVVIMSLKLVGMRRMKALRPDWSVGLLSSVALGDITRLDVDFLAVNASLATSAFVRRAHARNKSVYTWTVNDPAGVSSMIGAGVDAIITDRPAMVRTVMEQRRELALHERLILELASQLGSDFDSAGENNTDGSD